MDLGFLLKMEEKHKSLDATQHFKLISKRYADKNQLLNTKQTKVLHTYPINLRHNLIPV